MRNSDCATKKNRIEEEQETKVIDRALKDAQQSNRVDLFYYGGQQEERLDEERGYGLPAPEHFPDFNRRNNPLGILTYDGRAFKP